MRRSEEILHKRRKFFRQLITLLEILAPCERITFSQLDREFFQRTNERFEDIVDQLRRYFPHDNWSPEEIFRNLLMVKHSVQIDHDEIGDLVLIVGPKSSEPQRPPRTLEIQNIQNPTSSENIQNLESRLQTLQSLQNQNLLYQTPERLQNQNQTNLNNARLQNPEDVPIPTPRRRSQILNLNPVQNVQNLTSSRNFFTTSSHNQMSQNQMSQNQNIPDDENQVMSQMSKISLTSSNGSGRDVSIPRPLTISKSEQHSGNNSTPQQISIGERDENGNSTGTRRDTMTLQNLPIPAWTSTEGVETSGAPPPPQYRRINISPDVQKLFKLPHWPGASDEFREHNADLYLKFLSFAQGKDVKDRDVLRQAKTLAVSWWRPHLIHFPQALFLLKRLAQNNPLGVDLREFEKAIEEVYPPKWKTWNPNSKCILSDLRLNVADLVELNIIVQCDFDNLYLFKINKVIEILEQHYIIDKEISLIYQYASEKNEAVQIEDVVTFVGTSYDGWMRVYDDMEKGKKRVMEICRANLKMFDISDTRISAKDHAHKIALPFYFHSTPE